MNISILKGVLGWVIIGGTVGILLGMWIGYTISQKSILNEDTSKEIESSENMESDTEGASSIGAVIGSASVTSGDGALVEVNSQSAGYVAIVSNVDMPRDGWIAVHETQEDGIIGNILGAARRDAGIYKDVVVDLLRATEPGRNYVVVLYADNGNKEFDLSGDEPITSADGTPILEVFTATDIIGPSGQ